MKIRHFNALPKPYGAYAKVVKSLIQKPTKKEKVLPQVEYVVDRLSIDPQHLARYNDICGYADSTVVPATYLAVLAQSLQMQMMTTEAFPFALLGLVHIRNQVKQLKPVHTGDIVQLSCKFGELQPHDKGLQFDFIIQVKVGNTVVVEGLTTYLARQKVEKTVSEKAKTEQVPAYQLKESWSVAENTGRRYAMVSGDFNLIHIHAISAKAFGFNRAIAHGMWSKAKVLASLAPLPDAYEADVWFKLPMYLPSEVELYEAKVATTTDFIVRNKKNQKPHLSGKLTVL